MIARRRGFRCSGPGGLRQLPSNAIDQLKTSLSCIRLTHQVELDLGQMSVGDLSSKNSLVPLVATLHRVLLPCLSHLRSEAPFLAHLIMTADPIQKTQTVGRATPRQAQAAYQSASQNATQAVDHNHHHSA